MKVTTPEISWHNKDPVYSVDVQKKIVKTVGDNVVYRIATGGTDCHVLIWHVSVGDEVKVEFAADLNRHQKSVNVVRFSPSGEYLASGDDDGVVIIWKQKEAGEEQANLFDDCTDEGVESWTALKVLRGHLEDVYSLAWSPDSKCLVSGSVDNSAIIWNAVEAKKLAVLKDHKGFVQGVSWCPKNKLIATIGTDRVCRVFSTKTHRPVARMHQGVLDPKAFSEDGTPKQYRLFHDDTLGTFFRRLSFSPDGELLVVPAGHLCPRELRKKQQVPNATFVFSTRQLKQPVMYLPTGDKYTIAVSFCPVFFELLPGSEPVVPLPYRVIWAVATQNAVLLYDSQHTTPLAYLSHIHYTRLSDLNWSADGRLLVVASTDGYCSCVTFLPDELGTPLADQDKYKPQLIEEKKKGKNKKGKVPLSGEGKENVSVKQEENVADAKSEPEKKDVEMEEAEEEIVLVLEDTQDVDMPAAAAAKS